MDSTAIKQAVQEALKAAPDLINQATGLGSSFWQGILIGAIGMGLILTIIFVRTIIKLKK